MTAPDYPGHGKPCNGCGICCRAELCPVGMAVFTPTVPAPSHVPGPCPALEREGERFRCGLVNNPAKYAPARAKLHSVDELRSAALLLLGQEGCDMQVDDGTADLAYLERMHNPSILESAFAEISANIWGFSFLRPRE